MRASSFNDVADKMHSLFELGKVRTVLSASNAFLKSDVLNQGLKMYM